MTSNDVDMQLLARHVMKSGDTLQIHKDFCLTQ